MDFWPSTLETDRSSALRAARQAVTVVDNAISGADPACVHEAGARARAAFRAASVLMLAAQRERLPGRRWSRRVKMIRGMIDQNAEAGADLAGALLQSENGDRRRLLLDLSAALWDLVYYLDVLGRR